MTCILNASYVPEVGPVSWLHLDSPPGPRLPRTRSSSGAVSGPVISTETRWTDVGSLGIEMRQAFHEQHLLARREALASTAKHLRNQSRCKEASSAMNELRAVTHELLSSGEP